jgi:hypothetical protein
MSSIARSKNLKDQDCTTSKYITSLKVQFDFIINFFLKINKWKLIKLCKNNTSPKVHPVQKNLQILLNLNAFQLALLKWKVVNNQF